MPVPETPSISTGKDISTSVSVGRLMLFISSSAVSVDSSLCTITVNVLSLVKVPFTSFAVKVTLSFSSGEVTGYSPEAASVTFIIPSLSDVHFILSPESVIFFPVPAMTVGETAALLMASLTHCSSGSTAGIGSPPPEEFPPLPEPPLSIF